MKPDKSKTTYTLLNPETKTPPKIIFGTTALKWISAMVDIHTHEIGFYAIVDERGDYTFFVRDVFYPKHSEANAGTCEISPEGEANLMNWLCDNDREDDIPKIRLWGHSHHNMGTGPSQQDENQAIERMNSTKSFLIRVICNKDGEMACSFFDYNNKIRFDHVKWEVEDDCNDSQYDEMLEEIESVMNSNNMTPQEKIEEIEKISKEDNQTENIRDKIKDLKKINLPEPKTYTYKGKPKYSRSGYQENLFNKKRYYGYPQFEDDYDDMDFGYERSVEKDDKFDKTDVDTMIKNWENFEEGMGVTK